MKIFGTVLAICFILGLSTYASRELLFKQKYFGKTIQITKVGDDFVEFYLSYPSRKVKVEVVSREGVRYGVTTYQISPEEVNQLKYQPRMHDFRRGTYHLEVWDGSRIRSEGFRVTGWTENPSI